MSAHFLAWLDELFEGFGPITTRAMFGGHGVYHAGKILGIVIDDALYLKADAETALSAGQPGLARLAFRAYRQFRFSPSDADLARRVRETGN